MDKFQSFWFHFLDCEENTWRPKLNLKFCLFILSEFKGYFFEWLNYLFFPFFFWVIKKGRKILDFSCIFSCYLFFRRKLIFPSYRACMLTADSLPYLACNSSLICLWNADLKGDLSGFKFLLRMNGFQSIIFLFLLWSHLYYFTQSFLSFFQITSGDKHTLWICSLWISNKFPTFFVFFWLNKHSNEASLLVSWFFI